VRDAWCMKVSACSITITRTISGVPKISLQR
jgi:hypothetical protein